MASLNSLSDLYLHTLRDLYDAEGQIADALPKLASAAQHPELQQAFESHLAQTKEQRRRIEQICEALGKSPRGETCKGIAGVLDEGREILKMSGEPDVKDAALIAAAQRVEHYEIAGYGCAKTYARLLGREQDVRLLQQSENEEGETDQLLTRLAERVVNRDAIQDVAVARQATPAADLRSTATGATGASGLSGTTGARTSGSSGTETNAGSSLDTGIEGTSRG